MYDAAYNENQTRWKPTTVTIVLRRWTHHLCDLCEILVPGRFIRCGTERSCSQTFPNKIGQNLVIMYSAKLTRSNLVKIGNISSLGDLLKGMSLDSLVKSVSAVEIIELAEFVKNQKNGNQFSDNENCLWCLYAWILLWSCLIINFTLPSFFSRFLLNKY